ncbi:HD domain-containing protein, partial [Microlunatus aurantiacus]|uniref:HD domain-containing protein n=1 Tax=Microlunatus aurantiacus TaxID=446786 RepID=UPI0031D6FB70
LTDGRLSRTLAGVESVVLWARRTAEHHLLSLGRRWDHVAAVGRAAEGIAGAFGDDGETLIAAAFLHDIGYAPELAVTGFHPLDGGRFVRGQGYERLARLVAHHSGARLEARLRGIDGYCDEFPFEDGPLDHALTFCDLTTGPDGVPVSLERRVQEISERYGPDAVTARAIAAGVPEFERACRLTELRVAASVD